MRWKNPRATIAVLALLAGPLTAVRPLATAEGPAAAPAAGAAQPAAAETSGLTRLTPDYDLWVDLKRKLVVVDGRICLREGVLEVFACPRGTKEHEAIVAVNCKSQFVHAALLAVGAKPGKPMQYQPEYKPATGTIIDVFVLWKDEQGNNRKVSAQEWIKVLKTGKAMPHHWVFGGSGFWTDPETKKQHYYADSGELICVSNFSGAMLDLPIASTADNDDLQFAAFTERIPPLGTKVRLVLIPRPEEKTKEAPAEKPKQP
jgi:hypothetical protein